MRTFIIVFLSVLFMATAATAGSVVYPTLPGTSIRDFSKPGMVIQRSPITGRGSAYQTFPGTRVRDYSQPGYNIREGMSGKTAYPTLPGTNVRDYSKPVWKIKTDR